MEVYHCVVREGNQSGNVSMTVLTRDCGETEHPLLRHLPCFTCNKDRAVVLNLLCNVCGLCYDGYRNVSCRTEGEIQQLLEGAVKCNGKGLIEVDCRNRKLFAIEAQNLLRLAAGKVTDNVAEIKVRWACVCLNLFGSGIMRVRGAFTCKAKLIKKGFNYEGIDC